MEKFKINRNMQFVKKYREMLEKGLCVVMRLSFIKLQDFADKESVKKGGSWKEKSNQISGGKAQK